MRGSQRTSSTPVKTWSAYKSADLAAGLSRSVFKTALGVRPNGRFACESAVSAPVRPRLGGSIENNQSPDDARAVEAGREATALDGLPDQLRRVAEDVELDAEDLEEQVGRRQAGADVQAAVGKGEDERLTRMIGRRGREAGHLRVAAEDAVEDDHVGRLHGVPPGGEVEDLALNLLGQPLVLQKLGRRTLVCGGQLDVDRPLQACLQQLDLDGAQPATDLEQRPALDAPILDRLRHLLGQRVEALLSVALA